MFGPRPRLVAEIRDWIRDWNYQDKQIRDWDYQDKQIADHWVSDCFILFRECVGIVVVLVIVIIAVVNSELHHMQNQNQ